MRETLMRVRRLVIPCGGLTLVVGATASGKSTLVNALIGEALVGHGTKAKRGGSVAYVAQEAWIMNATLRENITLGAACDETRYIAAVQACHLMSDLEQVSASDHTEIGERGINLSGGQRQRVALARAVYSDRDIVVMDDPLSAVDPHVCDALFHECICGALQHKSRVLVTHQQQFLPFADQIVLVDQREVVFVGTHAELQARPELHELVGKTEGSPSAGARPMVAAPGQPVTLQGSHDEAAHAEAAEAAAKRRRTIPAAQPTEDGMLVDKEAMETGDVKFTVVVWYLRQSGVAFFVLIILLLAAWRVASVTSDMTMSWWASRGQFFGCHRLTENQYLMCYFVGVAVTGVLVFLRQMPVVISTRRASLTAHATLVDNLLHAPLSFFDTTPTGRIINRFSKDMETLDLVIPESLNFLYNMLFVILGAWVVMTIGVFWIAIAIVFIVATFVAVYTFYISTNSALKRLDAVNRSPVVATLTETLGGLPSIRAYGLRDAYRAKHNGHFAASVRSTYSWRTVQRWLGVRVDFLSAAVALATCLFAVAILAAQPDTAGRINALAFVNLAVSYSVGMAPAVGFFTTMVADCAASFSSVERVREYITNMPRERTVEYSVAPDGPCPPPPAGWPAAGAISFERLSLRYRPGLPLVLKDVSFRVEAGMKVGVVGRTGSGKSTLMLALFRMVELADDGPGGAAARIVIDGVDVAGLQLPDLRSKITIIPQDPVLFIGTVRSNLDPFGRHGDTRLWDVLEQCSMATRVRGETAGLDAAVVEKGANFSVGERQLLCLARAMLKDCRILLLDEATASIDPLQDEVLQRTIRRAFAHCTVLTIAHRLGTIIDSDRVLVLRDGCVAQYDAPAALLRDKAGLFAEMVGKLGPELSAALSQSSQCC